MVTATRFRLRNAQQIARALRRKSKAVQDVIRDERGEMQNIIISAIKGRFVSKTDPTGKPWAPLSKGDFPRSNPDKSDILIDTGKLLNAIGVVKKNTSLGGNTGFGFRVGISGDVPYAETMQEGGTSDLTGGPIPARPFMGITRAEVELVVDYATVQAKKALSRR